MSELLSGDDDIGRGANTSGGNDRFSQLNKSMTGFKQKDTTTGMSKTGSKNGKDSEQDSEAKEKKPQNIKIPYLNRPKPKV